MSIPMVSHYYGEFTVDLTCVTNSKLGKVIGDLFPKGNMLGVIKYYGCPFDGMNHRLSIIGNQDDVLTWLELLKEKAQNKKYKGSEAINEIQLRIDAVNKQINLNRTLNLLR